MMEKTPRVAIFGSGYGSNMQYIVDAIQRKEITVEVALVASDKPDSYILQRAKKHNIASWQINCGDFKTKFPYEEQLLTLAKLKELTIDWIFLAGFMRLLHADFIAQFPQKIINIHPSLLPAYPGLNSLQRSWQDRTKITHAGCTVHYVDSGMDTGDIIDQQTFLLRDEMTLDEAKQAMSQAEKILYPRALQKIGF